MEGWRYGCRREIKGKRLGRELGKARGIGEKDIPEGSNGGIMGSGRKAGGDTKAGNEAKEEGNDVHE